MKTILVVDDTEDMRELLRTILELEGYEVLLAKTGNEGLNILISEQNISLVLLDYQLGDMDGPEFVKRLKERSLETYKTARIVLVTGENNPPLNEFLGVISKMSDLKLFVKKIAQFIEKKGGE